MLRSILSISAVFALALGACGGSSSTNVASGDAGGDDGGSSGASSSSGSGSSSGASTSSSSSGAGSSSSSGGPPPSGTVTASGGTVSSLYFAAVGDTRPPNPDDTSGYPTAIITQIFKDIQNLNPRPLFGVSSGDYMYTTPGRGTSMPQLDLYTTARGNFSNIMFPTMGNHECNGYTSSNCGPGTTDSTTENYNSFMSVMLKPLNQTNPYYSININATDGSWTSKFIFVAANAWTSTQQTWLETTMAKQTTYTFLIRHEPSYDGGSSGAPGVDPAEAIMAKYPYTLSICGHTHTYERTSRPKEVIFGNGGAPLSSKNYGFGLITQRPDKTIRVDAYDYQSVKPDSSFAFALNPDGSAAKL